MPYQLESCPTNLPHHYTGDGVLPLELHQNREVVVSERGADRVSVFGPDGEKLRSFGSHGSGHAGTVCVMSVR